VSLPTKGGSQPGKAFSLPIPRRRLGVATLRRLGVPVVVPIGSPRRTPGSPSRGRAFQVGRHDSRRTSVEGERRDQHPPVPDGYQVGLPDAVLLLEQRDRVGAVHGRRPSSVAGQRRPFRPPGPALDVGRRSGTRPSPSGASDPHLPVPPFSATSSGWAWRCWWSTMCCRHGSPGPWRCAARRPRSTPTARPSWMGSTTRSFGSRPPDRLLGPGGRLQARSGR
jgi:hypothetical protein